MPSIPEPQTPARPAAPEPLTVSVIIVTRDRPGLLPDALRSVATQSLAPLEVRIADDGDAPLNADLVHGILPAASLLRSDARQTGGSRNVAAEAARGDILAFLDDDDRWKERHLVSLASAFADSNIEVAYSDVEVIRESVSAAGRRTLDRRIIARDWDWRLMRSDDFIPPSAFAVRRSRFEQLGGFDRSFRFSEDWDFLLRAAAYAIPRRVPSITAEIRLRAHGNASLDRGPERIDCLERLAARHGLPPLEVKTFWEVAAAVAGDSARGVPA